MELSLLERIALAGRMAFVAAMLLATSAQGAVALKNADWATASFVTNGMEAAHETFPSGVTEIFS